MRNQLGAFAVLLVGLLPVQMMVCEGGWAQVTLAVNELLGQKLQIDQHQRTSQVGEEEKIGFVCLFRKNREYVTTYQLAGNREADIIIWNGSEVFPHFRLREMCMTTAEKFEEVRISKLKFIFRGRVNGKLAICGTYKRERLGKCDEIILTLPKSAHEEDIQRIFKSFLVSPNKIGTTSKSVNLFFDINDEDSK
jgi:hypothetical protein